MRIVVAVAFVLMLMSFPGSGRGATALGNDAGGAPGAADLFRAKQRADEARRRLEIPRGEPRGWKRGGDGWWKGREREAAPPAPGAGPARGD